MFIYLDIDTDLIPKFCHVKKLYLHLYLTYNNMYVCIYIYDSIYR